MFLVPRRGRGDQRHQFRNRLGLCFSLFSRRMLFSQRERTSFALHSFESFLQRACSRVTRELRFLCDARRNFFLKANFV
jgi:hypothetical protein